MTNEFPNMTAEESAEMRKALNTLGDCLERLVLDEHVHLLIACQACMAVGVSRYVTIIGQDQCVEWLQDTIDRTRQGVFSGSNTVQ